MTPFHIQVLGFIELTEIAGAWSAEDYGELLGRMDIEGSAGLSSDDLREVCVMGLQDRTPAAAAALLLEYRLGDVLGKGQIQNMSQEMLDEKLWEEYAEMPLHERLFHVGSLLYQAFPKIVPVPDAVDLRFELKAEEQRVESLLAGTLHESLVVRLLADGMPDSAPLNRLFRDAIGGKPFPEAESIAWIVESEPVDAGKIQIRVIGSGYWLDDLRETISYASSARADSRRA